MKHKKYTIVSLCIFLFSIFTHHVDARMPDDDKVRQDVNHILNPIDSIHEEDFPIIEPVITIPPNLLDQVNELFVTSLHGLFDFEITINIPDNATESENSN